jgi:hypothetical protein
MWCPGFGMVLFSAAMAARLSVKIVAVWMSYLLAISLIASMIPIHSASYTVCSSFLPSQNLERS